MTQAGEVPVFGDAMFEEEERLRRAANDAEETGFEEHELEDVVAAGGLDERLRRRQAIAQLLREVGGC